MRATTTQNPDGSEGHSNNTIYSILLTMSKLLHPYCTSLPTALMLTSYLVRINSPPDATHRSMCAISSILPSLHPRASKRLLVTAFGIWCNVIECSGYKNKRKKKKIPNLLQFHFPILPILTVTPASIKNHVQWIKKLTLSAHEFCKERHFFRHFTPSR